MAVCARRGHAPPRPCPGHPAAPDRAATSQGLGMAHVYIRGDCRCGLSRDNPRAVRRALLRPLPRLTALHDLVMIARARHVWNKSQTGSTLVGSHVCSTAPGRRAYLQATGVSPAVDLGAKWGGDLHEV